MPKTTAPSVSVNRIKLGQLISEIRKRQHNLIKDAAKEIKINNTTLSKIENGVMLIDHSTLDKICTQLKPTKAELGIISALHQLTMREETLRVVGRPARELVSNLETQLAQRNDKQLQKTAKTRAKNHQHAGHEGFMAQALLGYYTPKSLARGKLAPYTFTVDGTRVEVPVASRPEWIGQHIPLEKNNEHCQLVETPLPEVKIPSYEEILSREQIYAEQMGARIWNGTIYRLIDVALTPQDLTASFAVDEFFEYKYGIDLLRGEILDALTTTNFDVDKVLKQKAKLLPLRKLFLADGARLADFENRMCNGGIATLCAIARPESNDFMLSIDYRSENVADGQGKINILPQAFHQPMVEARAEIWPSSTIFREVYEELFSGDDAIRNVRNWKADWYMQKHEHMRWFLRHPDRYRLECTCFGVGLTSGNYVFGNLLYVPDEEYWKQFGDLIQPNWETADERRELQLVSSRDQEKLSSILKRTAWDEEALFSVVESLQRLQALESKKVNLPDIERVMP